MDPCSSATITPSTIANVNYVAKATSITRDLSTSFTPSLATCGSLQYAISIPAAIPSFLTISGAIVTVY